MQSLGKFFSAARRTAILTCIVFFAAGLTIAVIGPSLPVLAQRSGAEIASLGGLFTAFSAGVILTQLGVAWASRRFGQRTTLVASMLLMGLGSVAIAQGAGLVALFAAALVAGIGFGGVLAMGNTLVAQLFPAHSAAVLNGINLFFGIGSITGPVLAASMNARLGTPQLGLWIGAGALAVLAPLVLVAAARNSSAATATHVTARASGSAQGWLFGFLLLIYVGVEIGFSAWLALYMVTSAKLDVASAALVVSAFWLALTSGRAIAAAIGVRISGQRMLKICLSGMLLGAVVLALSIGNLALTVAGVLILGLSCGPVFPTVIAIVTSNPSSTATSKVLALGNGGGMLVPALIGVLLTNAGPLAVTALLIVAALAMIGLGELAVRPRHEPRVPGDVEYVPAK